MSPYDLLRLVLPWCNKGTREVIGTILVALAIIGSVAKYVLPLFGVADVPPVVPAQAPLGQFVEAIPAEALNVPPAPDAIFVDSTASDPGGVE